MSYTIITHNGKAHLDELLGTALLAIHIGESPKEIKRVNAQEGTKMVTSGDLDFKLNFSSKRTSFCSQYPMSMDVFIRPSGTLD